jgi:hypothetical protein
MIQKYFNDIQDLPQINKDIITAIEDRYKQR